jgi:hypothetical protein
MLSRRRLLGGAASFAGFGLAQACASQALAAVATTAQAWSCLGDSITFGGPTRMNIPYPAVLDLLLFPTRCSGNNGIGGDTIAQIQTRYLAGVKGKGFRGIVLMGGINDLLTSQTAAATFATWNAIVTDALAAGMKVIGVTVTPCKNCSTWSAPEQVEIAAFNAAVLGRTPHASFYALDLYTPFGDVDVDELKVAYRDPLDDKLHWGQAGCNAAAALVRAAILAVDP